jgi:hypothetical protein
VHPDLVTAPAEEDGAARLIDAYKILINYTEALPSASGGEAAGATGYRFDRNTVEGSVRVMVCRQELATAHAEARP